jgi:tetratricopeptide (TPR) repeat protein
VLADQRSLDGADTQRVRNAHYQLGLALAEVGDLAEAIDELRTTESLEARHNRDDNEDRLAYGFALGAALQFAWRDNDAIEQYERMFELHRRLGGGDGGWIRFSRMRHARSLAMAGRDREAVQAIEALLALPDTGADLKLEAQTVLALNHRLQGRAQAAWDQAQRSWIDPARATARPRQHAEQALALYERAQVGVSPLSAAAWLVQAQLDLAAGKVQGAHNALSAVHAAWATSNPGSVWQAESALALATAQERMGHPDAARDLRGRARPVLAQAPAPSMKALATRRSP